MKLISHRGNLKGKVEEMENHPDYILKALEKGYDCEIDLWFENQNLYLGHDGPQYEIDISFLTQSHQRLWVHCKNIAAIEKISHHPILHYFWHEEDTLVLTSKSIIWAYPGKQPIHNSVAVMPEINNERNLDHCYGICSDFIEKYRCYENR